MEQLTIGIALACESGNCVILAADTKGTYASGHVRANEEVGKQFQLPAGFFACVAGRLVHCESLIAYFTTLLEDTKIDRSNVLHDHVRDAMRLAQANTVRDLYDNAMLQESGMRFDEWKELMAKDERMYKRGFEIFARTDMVVELLVGGFSQDNFVLLRLHGKGLIEIVPSFDTIGSGADFALNRLNDRTQNLHMSFPRSVLHVAEALQEAKLDPGVGDTADWVVMEKTGRIWRLPAKHQVIGDLMHDYAGKASSDLDSDAAIRTRIAAAMYQAPLMPFKFSGLEV